VRAVNREDTTRNRIAVGIITKEGMVSRIGDTETEDTIREGVITKAVGMRGMIVEEVSIKIRMVDMGLGLGLGTGIIGGDKSMS
jgi:hypothetical protein